MYSVRLTTNESRVVLTVVEYQFKKKGVECRMGNELRVVGRVYTLTLKEA
jgi:hypothetical protein